MDEFYYDDEYEDDELFPRANTVIGDYQIISVIYRGYESYIYQVMSRETNAKYAMKCILLSSENKERVNNECNILTLVKNDNVIKSIESFDYQKLYRIIIMPYAFLGDAFSLIEPESTIQLNEDIACKIVYEALKGIEYLHGLGIWHRDVKPENIFLMNDDIDNLDVVIGDLGFSKFFQDGEKCKNEFLGTLEYAAPELIIHQGYTESVDMWALGVTAYVLLVGLLPFEHDINNPKKDKISIITGKYKYPEEAKVSDSAKDFIAKLLCLNPEYRMTSEQALSHEWFSVLRENDAKKGMEQKAIYLPISDSIEDLNIGF